MIPESSIRIVRGTDISLRFTMMNVTAITGWAVTWTLKKLSQGSLGSALISKTVGSGVALTDTTNGIITVTIEDSDTDSLVLNSDLDNEESYLWDLKRTDAGSETVLARGDLVLLRPITA